jgi:uncharacterized protein YjbJ (UPF0337 family)
MTSESNWHNNWQKVAGKLRKQYPELTDADLAYTQGQEDEMFTRLEGKIGLTKRQIEELMLSRNSTDNTYDVTKGAFRGLPENDPDTSGMRGTYPSDNAEQDKLPRTHAPRSEGYDNGKVDSGSDIDPRR